MLNLALKGQLKPKSPRKKMMWFCLAFFVLVIDQLTKLWAVSVLDHSQSVAFLPFFNFTLLHNYGAAFSFLSDAGGWQRIFLGGVALLVSLLIAYWILCIDIVKKIELTGFSLVLGGAVGNLWDRITLGYVVDFIDWFYPASSTDCLPFFYNLFPPFTCHWPAFNIADASILLGVMFLLIDMFTQPSSK